MTNKEAIKYLKLFHGYDLPIQEAFDMAIEALKAQLSAKDTTLDMDLIDRQDAIDAICTWDKFGVDERGRVVRWYEGLEPYVHLRDVVFAIEKLPSAVIYCKDCVLADLCAWRREGADFCSYAEKVQNIAVMQKGKNDGRLNKQTGCD